MADVLSFIAAGLDSIQWAYRHSGGWSAGAANLLASDTGESSSMARLLGANAAPFQQNQPNIVNIPGDNTSLGQFMFKPTDRPTFQLTVSVNDFTFKGAISNLATVDEGDWKWSPNPPAGTVLNPMILLLSRNNQSQDSGSVGDEGWEHLLLFNTQLTYLGSGYNTQGAAVYLFQVIVNDSDTLHDGRTIQSVFGTQKMDSFEWSSANRVTMVTFVGDGTADDVVLTQKPLSPLNTAVTRATVETTGFAAGTVSAVDVTAPYGVTLSAAPGSGKFAIITHEFQNWEAA